MFSRISNTTIDIYDGETNEFVGEARFNLPSESENALLQLVNYNRTPESIILLNLNFYQPAERYIPPNIFAPVKRKGIIRALFTDSVTGEQAPMEIRYQFDARARCSSGNPYYFQSVRHNNIKVDSIEEIFYE